MKMMTMMIRMMTMMIRMMKNNPPGNNASHPGKSKYIFNSALGGDILFPRRVGFLLLGP